MRLSFPTQAGGNIEMKEISVIRKRVLFHKKYDIRLPNHVKWYLYLKESMNVLSPRKRE